MGMWKKNGRNLSRGLAIPATGSSPTIQIRRHGRTRDTRGTVQWRAEPSPAPSPASKRTEIRTVHGPARGEEACPSSAKELYPLSWIRPPEQRIPRVQRQRSLLLFAPTIGNL